MERCRALLLAANDDLRNHGRVGREGFYSREMQNLGVGGADNTKRLFDIIELDDGPEVLGNILARTDARLRPIVEAVLGAGSFLGSFQSLTLEPDGALGPVERSAQLKESLHADYPFYSNEQALPAGVGSPFTIQTIWMITDFTGENGGTPLLPGSHRLGRPPIPEATDRTDRGSAQGDDERHLADWSRFDEGSVATEGSAGDLLVYLGQCWHAVSVNAADEPRIGLLGQWLPFYFASMEAHMMTTPSEIKAALPDVAVDLLGLNHAHPM